MNFRVKNLEELEGKEDWGNLFTEKSIQFRVVPEEMAKSYEEFGLDSSVWKEIKPKQKSFLVYQTEFRPEWAKEKLIPCIEQGLEKMKKKKESINTYYLSILEDVLKVAKTCARLKRAIVITGF